MKTALNYMAAPGIEKVEFETLDWLQKRTVFKQVLAPICKVWNEDVEEVLEHPKTRKREWVEIRQIAMTIMRKRYKTSLAEAGSFCSKDHATVIHAIKTVKALRETDKAFQLKTNDFLKDIQL